MASSEQSTERVASPCVGICQLGNDAICVGCFRQSDEITYWTTFSEEQKRKVVADCQLRAKRADEIDIAR